MAFFSILVPVYNQVGKMDKCIGSIYSQTFKDFEVLMVDDGSTDDSYKMLCEFAEKDSRIKILRQEKNSSLVAGRYLGMQKAAGEYIIFLDSDDYMENNMLEVLYNRITQTQPDILRFGNYREPMHEAIAPKPVDDLKNALYTGKITPAIWKNAYKRTVTDKLVENTKPFYCNMGEDVYFSTVFYTFADKIDRIDDILYYHEMDTGMSSVNNDDARGLQKLGRSISDTLASGEHIVEFLEKFDPEILETAKKHIISMQVFAFNQNVIYLTDYKKIVEYAYEYKRLGADDAYNRICNELIRLKVLVDEGYIVPENGKFVRKKVVENE